jgi:rare lipoprotein A
VLGAAALLSGCGSAPTTRPGGFYENDGPPDKVPADLASRPDPVPRVEPFHPYANRPYTALGRRYAPMTEDRPFRARGLASWYGRQFHGARTSSGEPYDMFAFSAAHPTMPIPSYARVTHTRNGASVIVRVNDRGPFKPDRVIDLSYAAAVRLGLALAGTGEVDVVRLTFEDIRALRGERPPPEPVAATPAGPWSVQLGAFAQAANAEELRDQVAVQLRQADSPLGAHHPRIERDGSIFRVLVGAVADRVSAQQLAQHLARVLGRDTALFMR